jgi:predicted dehydrogenase
VIARTKVGFAVVGLGKIAQGSVLPAFKNSKSAKLVALVGRNRNKTAELARRFHAIAIYQSDEYAACLANSDVSAVYIATPPGEHARLTIQAAEAGKHVLCEKPLAATVEQSAAMVEACRQNGVLLMTAYRKYYEPSTLHLKQLIQSGKLGRIDAIHTAFSELYAPGVSQSWLLDSKLAGGGPLMDLGVYCVNTTRWLVDENPTQATAQSWTNDTKRFQEVEEGVSFRLQSKRVGGTRQFVVCSGAVVIYICSGNEGLGFVGACISIRRSTRAHRKNRKAQLRAEVPTD